MYYVSILKYLLNYVFMYLNCVYNYVCINYVFMCLLDALGSVMQHWLSLAPVLRFLIAAVPPVAEHWT